MTRAACLIDGAFLSKMSKGFGTLPIDHRKLAGFMVGGVDMLRTYYYDCKPYTSSPTPTADEITRQSNYDKFIKTIEMLPHFECRFGRLEKRQNGTTITYEQKRVDVMMAIDLVNLSSKRLITHASIMSGDSDLIPAIQIAKNEGVVVRLFCFDGSTHYDLMQVCDEVTIIDKKAFLEKCCRDTATKTV